MWRTTGSLLVRGTSLPRVQPRLGTRRGGTDRNDRSPTRARESIVLQCRLSGTAWLICGGAILVGRGASPVDSSAPRLKRDRLRSRCVGTAGRHVRGRRVPGHGPSRKLVVGGRAFRNQEPARRRASSPFTYRNSPGGQHGGIPTKALVGQCQCGASYRPQSGGGGRSSTASSFSDERGKGSNLG